MIFAQETESQTCEEAGTELIDGICEIIDYRAYHAYRITHIENFPDPKKSPQYYIDRYNSEPEYKLWFDSQFPDKSVEEVVGYRETHIAGFPDNSKSPEHYIHRLHLEASYEQWFDEQFPTLQIYNIVGIDLKQYLQIIDSFEFSKAEKKAREEIPNPCEDIPEPKVSTEYQGDIGLNNPAYIEAVREAQYQYQQKVQECLKEFQNQIDEKIKQPEIDPCWADFKKRNDAIMKNTLESSGNVDAAFYASQKLYLQYLEKCGSSESIETEKEEMPEILMGDYEVCPKGYHKYGPSCISQRLYDEHLRECAAGLRPNNQYCPPSTTQTKSVFSGGCLIATATFGSEISPQVQQLRELRDNVLLETKSGSAFLSGFNQFYYSFSPTIADWERQNPVFKEIVKLFITPMISTLSIMTLAEEGSESHILGLGISVIALNLGLYIAFPIILICKLRKRT